MTAIILIACSIAAVVIYKAIRPLLVALNIV